MLPLHFLDKVDNSVDLFVNPFAKNVLGTNKQFELWQYILN